MNQISDWVAGDGLAVKLVISILVLLGGWIAIRITGAVLRKILDRSAIDAVLYPFIINTLKVVLWLMIILTTLSYLGVPMSAFITAVGAAGVAVALALKDSLSNFAGGILILFSKPFKKGDFIEDLEVSGKVEEINMLYTTISTNDNRIITMPNGKLANATVINHTKESLRRLDMSFSAAYDTDIGKVKDILLATAAATGKVLQEPAPFAGVSAHGDSAVQYDLRVWCRTEEYLELKYKLQEMVKKAFDENEISIPYPQMDVRLINQDFSRR